MTLAWLVGMMALYCITRTTSGKLLLGACSSLCNHDTKDEDEVQAKGIGYFDGSPGLRRFVLIEDENDEEDEENASEFKDFKKKNEKEAESEERGDRISKTWEPPRSGTYILQETSKKDVLEVGTYILQEKEEEENGEERDGRGKKEVEYILEGATYILQSERVALGVGADKRGCRPIRGTEAPYGIIGSEVLQGEGYGRMRMLEDYGIMGREVENLCGRERYGKVRMEKLYEILQGEVTEGGGGGGRGGNDGVLLSVRELLGAMGERENEEKVRNNSKSEGETGDGWRQVGQRDEGGKQGEGKGERKERGFRGSKVKVRGTHAAKWEKEGKRVDEREGKRNERGEVYASDIWGGRKRRVSTGLGGVGEGSWECRAPPSPKRAASFPMDHFLSSHLMPRKLSLILEEDNH